jgi:hypothetical protein
MANGDDTVVPLMSDPNTRVATDFADLRRRLGGEVTTKQVNQQTKQDKIAPGPKFDIGEIPKAPPIPQLQEVPPAPQTRIENPMRQFGGPAMFFLGLGAALSRNHMTTALNAATAMIKGDLSGQFERAEIAQQNWKNATAAAVEHNNTIIQQYKLLLQDRDMKINEKMAALAGADAAYGKHPMIQLALMKGDIGMAEKFINDMDRQNTNMAKFALETDKFNETRRHHLQTEQQHRQGVQSQAAKKVIDDLQAGRNSAYGGMMFTPGDLKELQNIKPNQIDTLSPKQRILMKIIQDAAKAGVPTVEETPAAAPPAGDEGWSVSPASSE